MTNIREILWETARSDSQRGLPILSFPAAQKMNVTVEQLVKDPELMAKAMQIVSEETHHLFEAIFKGFAKALDIATSYDERIEGVLSTKGCLD